MNTNGWTYDKYGCHHYYKDGKSLRGYGGEVIDRKPAFTLIDDKCSVCMAHLNNKLTYDDVIKKLSIVRFATAEDDTGEHIEECIGALEILRKSNRKSVIKEASKGWGTCSICGYKEVYETDHYCSNCGSVIEFDLIDHSQD